MLEVRVAQRVQEVGHHPEDESVKENGEVEEMVCLVDRVYRSLCSLADLSPNNPKANDLLSELVQYVTQPWDREVSKQALEILEERGTSDELRRLCQTAECELESFYSDAISSA